MYTFAMYDVKLPGGAWPIGKDWDEIAAALQKEGWAATRDKSEKTGEPILHVGIPAAMIKEAGLDEHSED